MFWNKKKTKKIKMNTSFLITLFYNCQKAFKIQYELPNNIKVKCGKCRWENNVEFESDKIRFIIQKESASFHSNGFNLEIFVEDILVYESDDSWLHKIPYKMQEQIVFIINNDIAQFNKKCKNDKIEEKYDALIKTIELEKKEKEIEKRKNEEKRLLKIFE